MADDKEISATFPFESRFIEVEGSKIHYVEEGTGSGNCPYVGLIDVGGPSASLGTGNRTLSPTEDS